MNVYIPSRGRAGQIVTPMNLTNTSVLVHEREYRNYRAAYPHANIQTHTCGHIGEIRQHVFDTALDPLVLMLDDDLLFYSRNLYDLTLTPTVEIQPLVDTIEFDLEVLGYAQVGIGKRPFNRYQPDTKIVYNCNSAWAVNTNILHQHNIRIPTEFNVQEDMWVTFSLFEQGHENIVHHDWVFRQKPMSGGCADYRNSGDDMFRTNKILAERFPEFVRWRKDGRKLTTMWKRIENAIRNS